MTSDIQLGSFSHAHCFNCKRTAEIGKFELRKNALAITEGIEIIQLTIICPICKDEHCEGLFHNELN